MQIGGLQKLTLIDYPKHLSALVFTQGCNFRCHYCYNPKLVLSPDSLPDKENQEMTYISNNDFFDFLKKRKGFLDAVTITGGEPTIHTDLPNFCTSIKNLGYLIKLDTNGSNPEMVENLIKDKLVDYLAMDIKAPWDKYEKVIGVRIDIQKLKQTVKVIMEKALDYEFRTTVIPEFLDKDDIKTIAEQIRGAKHYYLQQFKPNIDLVDPKAEKITPYKPEILKEMCYLIKDNFKECKIRGI